MSNRMYPLALDAFLTGLVDVAGDTINVVAVGDGYTYLAAHEFLASVDPLDQVAIETLAGVAVVGGVVSADPVTFPAVVAGSTITALIVYQDNGSDATSRLLAFMDIRADTSVVAIDTNDADIDVDWPDGEVFKI